MACAKSVSVDELGHRACWRWEAACAHIAVDALGLEVHGLSIDLHACLIEYPESQSSCFYKYEYKLPTDLTVSSPDKAINSSASVVRPLQLLPEGVAASVVSANVLAVTDEVV